MSLANVIHDFQPHHTPQGAPWPTTETDCPADPTPSPPQRHFFPTPARSEGQDSIASLDNVESHHQEDDGSSSHHSGTLSSPPTSPASSSQSDHKQHNRAHPQDNRHTRPGATSKSFTQPSPPSIQPSYFYPTNPSGPEPQDPESGVPVFEPTMEQFQDFYSFCQAIDSWGMKSGIVKIIPPKEWTDALPSLRAADVAMQKDQTTAAGTALPTLESVRIKSAIAQHFTPAAKPGLWKQTNITRPAKVWNVKQWADVCRENSGPSMKRIKELAAARERLERGEEGAKEDTSGIRTRSGKGNAVQVPERKAPAPASLHVNKKQKVTHPCPSSSSSQAKAQPFSPQLVSPRGQSGEDEKKSFSRSTSSPSPEERSIDGSPMKSHSSRGATMPPSKPKQADLTTPSEWDAFDYRAGWLKEWQAEPGENKEEIEDENDRETERVLNPRDWDPRSCREIEAEYWRGLNFGKPPMYGADLKGSLFTPQTSSWNVSNLDNLLTRLRLKRKIAGVTDPYLYFGMWRATFAWHVEDMDLYSINYIHFGAPKQWYAIPQKDRLRFETSLASVFPSDARRCSQFIRHKSFLASPSFLAANNIRPIKVVQHAQEFVITYPFGYHSGYNLGFNCAESVNFALEGWLDIGRKAKACDCEDAQQSVTMDVDALLEESEELRRAEQRKLEREQKLQEQSTLGEEKLKKMQEARQRSNERRRLKRLQASKAAAANVAGKHSGEHDGIKLESPPNAADVSRLEDISSDAEVALCVFCPSDVAEDLVPIPSRGGKAKEERLFAHRFCASAIPETWVAPSDQQQGSPDEVMGYEKVPKARWSLKCTACPTLELARSGCCVQCTFGSCSKAVHPSCATMESTGWICDFYPTDEADRLENKGRYASKGKKVKSSRPSVATEDGSSPMPSSLVADEADVEDRLVILCPTHNPSSREMESDRKLRFLRDCASRLKIGSRIEIKSGGGIWETTLVDVRDGNVIVFDGINDTSVAVKLDKVLFPTQVVAAAKAAMSTTTVVEAEMESSMMMQTPPPPPLISHNGSNVEPRNPMDHLLAAVSAAAPL